MDRILKEDGYALLKEDGYALKLESPPLITDELITIMRGYSLNTVIRKVK